jgi:protein-tyrosine kinase
MGRIEEALRRAKDQRAEVAPSANVDAVELSESRSIDSGFEHDVVIDETHKVSSDNENLREQRVIAASDLDERVGPYRQLRTQLLKTMRENNWNTLAITSAHVGAGKTLTSVNLAISLSRDVSTRVLLVDLDLYTPTVYQKLELPNKIGLIDYLEENASLQDITYSPGIEGLTVLVGRSAGKESSELLASPKMRELIQDLCGQDVANVTIFDLPPLLRNDDAILFAPFVDAMLVVVEDGVTTEDQLREAMRLLEKANVIGTILNKAGT